MNITRTNGGRKRMTKPCKTCQCNNCWLQMPDGGAEEDCNYCNGCLETEEEKMTTCPNQQKVKEDI